MLALSKQIPRLRHGRQYPRPVGYSLPVGRTGITLVEIRDLPASEVVVLANWPTDDAGAVVA